MTNDTSEHYKVDRIKANLELASVHLGNIYLYMNEDSPSAVGAIRNELGYIQDKLDEYISILDGTLRSNDSLAKDFSPDAE